MEVKPAIEVETRVFFTSPEEAFSRIPFLKEALTRKNRWSTTHYGFQLFSEDQVLRINQTIEDDWHFRFFLGWKGKDCGKFANIREEIDEEITNGIEDSRIFSLLGGATSHASPESVLNELNRLGFDAFMTFHGCNQTGFYQELGIDLKLMNCPSLSTPYIVEIEKTASHMSDALSKEEDLRRIVDELGLTNRLIHEEPPTLFYATLSIAPALKDTDVFLENSR